MSTFPMPSHVPLRAPEDWGLGANVTCSAYRGLSLKLTWTHFRTSVDSRDATALGIAEEWGRNERWELRQVQIRSLYWPQQGPCEVGRGRVSPCMSPASSNLERCLCVAYALCICMSLYASICAHACIPVGMHVYIYLRVVCFSVCICTHIPCSAHVYMPVPMWCVCAFVCFLCARVFVNVHIWGVLV